jgi:hypothetical protein
VSDLLHSPAALTLSVKSCVRTECVSEKTIAALRRAQKSDLLLNRLSRVLFKDAINK